MKLKNFAQLILLPAVIACNEEIPSGNDTTTPPVTDRTIEVSMPEMTRTALGAGTESSVSVVWSKGDEIAVIEGKGTDAQKHSVYRLVGEGGSASGTFEYVSGDAVGDVVTDVVFPASAVDNKYAVPAVQTYTEDSFDPSSMVMSWTRSNPDEAIIHKHDAAAFMITLTSESGQRISSVNVSCGRNTYVLTCKEPVTLSSEGKTFYIAVPGNNEVTDYTFTIFPQSGAPMVKTASHALNAGKIGVVPVSGFSPLKAGDFYAGGLVFEVTEEYAKVVSKDEGSCFWAQESVKAVRVGTDANAQEGETNTIMFKERADMELFDAAIWCINRGDEWYMPSRVEIAAIVNGLGLNTSDGQTNINTLLTSNGGTAFSCDKYYWTCCEHDTDDTKAFAVRLKDKGHQSYAKKGSSTRPVRAVKKVFFSSGVPEIPEDDTPVVEGSDYDVFLLIGQSNMAGRGYMTAADQEAFDPNVFILNADGEVEPAKNPLNAYSSIRKDLSVQGINPGFSFSKKIAAETGRKVLLVVNARGGTALYEWKPTSSKGYYNEAVRRTRQAQKYGKLVGILWHQGESNSSSPSGYLESLKTVVDDLRTDLNAPDVPFIAGEIAQWQTNASKFNPVIQGISAVIDNSDYVSSVGCTPLIDESDPHFSRDGQILLGERYAEKILEYCYGK